MIFGTKWDAWPCTHACTAFFHIAKREIDGLVPPPLVVDEVGGIAKIEVGFVRFRGGTHSLPPTDELAWGIAVKRVKGVGFAFYAMNIAADNEPFLHWNEGVGFRVHRPLARFVTDLDRRSFRVEDASGPICTLRHQPEGSLFLPTLPVTTEVWTGSGKTLARRVFKWRGIARVHFAASVASTLHDGHPFFFHRKLSRANPVPEQVLSSERFAEGAAQLFTMPE
ncbi:MAG: hypothetical protein JST00_15485 [Deltaproteobacteria bacterium]|nr:hypothetical protein [Deltaproteobacteria bacterium]